MDAQTATKKKTGTATAAAAAAPGGRGSIMRRPAWLPGKSPQFAAAIVVNLISFSFGCAAGWPAVAGPVLLSAGYSEEALSWLAALQWPCALVGALAFGPLAECLGRRRAALGVAAPLLAGWALLAADWGLAVLLLARALLGVGMGGVLVVVPMYVGETAEDALRGQLGSYLLFFVNAGILYVYAVGAQVSLMALALLCAAFPMAFVVLFFWFPETPRYLLSRGDEASALAAITWLRDPRRADLTAELAALRASLKRADVDDEDDDDAAAAEGQQVGARLRDLVATRGARRAMLVVLGLMALQQFSGINAILNYAVAIFEMAAGGPGGAISPSASACIVAGVQLVGSVVACLLMDRLGRVPLLAASGVGMALSLAVLGACMRWTAALPSWLPVLCVSVFVLAYALGAGPGPYVLLVEVFPVRLLALASQFGLGFLFTLAFVVSKFFSQLADALGAAGCFWLFAGCCAAGVVFVLLVVPETKGRAVEDIVAQLEGERVRVVV